MPEDEILERVSGNGGKRKKLTKTAEEFRPEGEEMPAERKTGLKKNGEVEELPPMPADAGENPEVNKDWETIETLS